MKYFTDKVTLHRRTSVFGYEPTLCRVDVAINMEALFRLIGERALDNKNKRTRLLGGIVTGEVRMPEPMTTN
jgi:hypothetical protein